MEQIFITPSHSQLSSITKDNLPFLLHNFTLIASNTSPLFLSIVNPQVQQNSYILNNPNQKTLGVTLAMTSTHIFIYDQNLPKFCTALTFELKFEILREEWRDQCTPGRPYGIVFEKDNCEPIKFVTRDVPVVEAWKNKLQEKINQRGFHKLFKAKKKIGKGAFATVYLAQRLMDKKLVAVKAFSKERQYSSDKGKDSLINELRLMRQLRNHPNVISLEGVFQTDNSIYVILQNLEGGQLHQKIKLGSKQFTLQQVTQIMLGILRGLSFMDSQRIIHRDLKPENLLFRSKHSNEVVIADFGLATWAEQPHYLFVRCGTPGFVAPQIINIKDMSTHSDPISDVFSAGLIFHFLLLGKSVFKGQKYAEILAQNRACDFVLSGPEYEKLDRNAYDLLCRMLDVNPKTRIRAVQALGHKVFRQWVMDEEGLQVENKEYLPHQNYSYSKGNNINIGNFHQAFQIFSNNTNNINNTSNTNNLSYFNSNDANRDNSSIYQNSSFSPCSFVKSSSSPPDRNTDANKENLMIMRTPRRNATNCTDDGSHNPNGSQFRKKRDTIILNQQGNSNNNKNGFNANQYHA